MRKEVMHRGYRYFFSSFFLTAALAAPSAMSAATRPQDNGRQEEQHRDDKDSNRVYDGDDKDYHNWDDNEDRVYRQYLEEKHRAYRKFCSDEAKGAKGVLGLAAQPSGSRSRRPLADKLRHAQKSAAIAPT